MFGKSAFIVRSLFVAFTVGSLVACTFESTPEGQGHSTSADSANNNKNSGNDKTLVGSSANDGGIDDSDGAVGDVDGGSPCDNDASVSTDSDGGTGDWGDDASTGDWGTDGGSADWGNNGGF